ncbi:hypothetical protein ACLKA6_006735 [Drosophila palustris]
MTHARSMLNGALATPTRVTRWLGGGVSGVSVGTLTFLEQCAASEAREEEEAIPEFEFKSQFEFMRWRLA